MTNLLVFSLIPSSQLLFLLRVFPDVESRLALLTLLQPNLWDPSRLVDVVLDLDHPVREGGDDWPFMYMTYFGLICDHCVVQVLMPLSSEEYKMNQGDQKLMRQLTRQQQQQQQAERSADQEAYAGAARSPSPLLPESPTSPLPVAPTAPRVTPPVGFTKSGSRFEKEDTNEV